MKIILSDGTVLTTDTSLVTIVIEDHEDVDMKDVEVKFPDSNRVANVHYDGDDSYVLVNEEGGAYASEEIVIFAKTDESDQLTVVSDLSETLEKKALADTLSKKATAGDVLSAAAKLNSMANLQENLNQKSALDSLRTKLQTV